jgi:light-regulated signal transduction histidine kinase (bacteriophytochrome)
LDARIANRTRELQKSNRRLNEFVHMVSHDLREPLRSVSSFSTLLRRRYGAALGEEGADLLDNVIVSASRMAMLIQDLLSYSRAAEGEFATEPVNLNEVVNAALNNLSEGIRRHQAEIETGELPVVEANFTQMMQLFQNLIDNALKYHSAERPRIQIRGERKGRGFAVSVIDNGVGIPAGERERVFAPFRRASNAACDGSGIGLAICQAIVERHDGRIWIEESAGPGTTFTFTIAEDRHAARHPQVTNQ